MCLEIIADSYVKHGQILGISLICRGASSRTDNPRCHRITPSADRKQLFAQWDCMCLGLKLMYPISVWDTPHGTLNCIICYIIPSTPDVRPFGMTMWGFGSLRVSGGCNCAIRAVICRHHSMFPQSLYFCGVSNVNRCQHGSLALHAAFSEQSGILP